MRMHHSDRTVTDDKIQVLDLYIATRKGKGTSLMLYSLYIAN